MAATRSPGITVDTDGNDLIDKPGAPICVRLGQTTLEQAEARLKREVAQLAMELARQAHSHPLFRDRAARYLAQRHERRSLATMQIHVRLLLTHIGDLEPRRVHDATLASFISVRVAAGASATTINRSLAVVRAILNRAARSYRDADGTPWLTGVPPLITMLPESRRPPYPITCAEQDRLFPGCLRICSAWRCSPSIGRVLQEQARPCRDPQRYGLVDRRPPTAGSAAGP